MLANALSVRLDFRKIETADKEWIDPLYKARQYRSCEYCFGNLYIWQEFYDTLIAKAGGFLTVKARKPQISYSFPMGPGSDEELAAVIEALMADAESEGAAFQMHGLVQDAPEIVERLFPGRFEFVSNRDASDYIYNGESLRTLAGKKLSAKRNHINNFLRQHPVWTYEEITPANIGECADLTDRWCEVNECQSDPGKAGEYRAVRRALDHFEELGLKGGLIRLDGEVIAFTAGEPLTDDTFVVHIEKTFADIQGAYPLINREFVRHAAADYRYINREEDLGIPGLRKAKLSYYPEIVLDKYVARLKV